MSYRDWERGETGPRERPPTSPWDGARPVEPYSRPPEGYRTRSRRRAAERGQQDPAEEYLPWWALESGVPGSGDEGRHGHGTRPDDDAPPQVEPVWRTTETTRTWSRVTGTTRWHEVPGSDPGRSEHTGEWRFADPAAEIGYVGSRRAGEEPDPTRAGSALPDVPSARSPVVWFGERRHTRSEDLPEAGGLSQRDWRAAEGSWPGEIERRPPHWDPASGGRPVWPADPAVASSAVDPWDASGLHAWGRPRAGTPNDTDRWAGTPNDTGQWARTSDSGQWDRTSDSGQWDRTAGTGGWGRSSDSTGQWGPDTGTGPWSPGDDTGPWGDAGARRWDGGPAGRAGGRPDGTGPAAERLRPAPVAATSSGRSAPSAATSSGRSARIEEDLLDPNPGGAARPLLYTVACYLLPAVALFVWLLTLSGQAPPGCVTDLTGGGCDSPRTHAIDSFVAGGPRFGLALATSLVVALLLRRVGTTWRAVSTALAAAVVGGGLSTVLISVVTGEPIG